MVVVNEAFVKKFFSKQGQDPLGQHFGTYDQKYAGNYEIIGVVSDAKYVSPREPVRPMFFRALNQRDTAITEPAAMTGEGRSLFIDSITLQYAGSPQSLEALARRTLANINPNLTMSDFHSLEYQVADNFNQERLIARLTMLFGFVALALASVGLYGLTAYSVARRTGEIGVRMAMGATRSNVIVLIMRGAMLQIAIGVAIGIPGALLGGRVMASQLYAVRTYDRVTLAFAVAVLAASAALAGFVPAKRASGIEPMNALRTE